jgi:putative hydrolase of the HAD superfamily
LKIHGVFFDLDYTLFDLRQYSHGALDDISEYLGTAMGRPVSEVRQVFLQELARGHQYVLNRGLHALGLTEHETLLATLVEIYRSHQPSLSLYPDVITTLQALREMGCKLGVVTNGTLSTQQKKVTALGLTAWLDVVVYADALGRAHWKPSALPYRVALEALESHPPETLYVGDDPRTDFQGALMTGMITVRILRGEFQHVAAEPLFPPDHIITSLAELLSLISRDAV